MKNLELVREKIIKANPSILDLKFGCVVRDFLKGDLLILAERQLYKDESPVYDYVFIGYEDISTMRSPRGNWDILGRPILLDDVLLALKTRYGHNNLISHPTERHKIIPEIEILYRWIPNKPLQDQPEPTINLLAELLK